MKARTSGVGPEEPCEDEHSARGEGQQLKGGHPSGENDSLNFFINEAFHIC